MSDEPTLGEVVRRLEAVHADLKDDMRELASRLDGKVSADVLRLEQAGQDAAVSTLAQRVKALEEGDAERLRQQEADRRERERQRAADRRLILTGLVVPVLLVLLQVYLATKGAST
ncbi:hypothetical protein ACFV3R_25440 [Streptomyces sp. NPDC059740]|uniref:hypothetical protein n=1 Tax=Streptomyces sp. NPDC059740 TaxID=3346926 RepID=UPI0036574CBD